MDIIKAHCLFEQSGTFKREFIRLGIPAEDYDILNEFGETDHIVNLFGEIDLAFEGGRSVFDTIGRDELIFAFFPCVYLLQIVWSYSGAISTNRGIKPTGTNS